jgi:hypothetical protein
MDSAMQQADCQFHPHQLLHSQMLPNLMLPHQEEQILLAAECGLQYGLHNARVNEKV